MNAENLDFEALTQTRWDCCVIGKGISSLWFSHRFWSQKKNVLWITSDEPYSSERALLQHAWLWGAGEHTANQLTAALRGFSSEAALPAFETAVFDARASKRFRRWSEVKKNWGEHEKDFFSQEPFDGPENSVRGTHDLWAWQNRLHQFHDSGASHGPKLLSLFHEPKFVRLQSWPVLELKTDAGKLCSVVLSGLKMDHSFEISAEHFILGDSDDSMAAWIKNSQDQELLSMALKGRIYRPGVGIKLWHSDLPTAVSQTLVVPLVANPSDKNSVSHVVGRFVSTDAGMQSHWISFLSDEDVEDNNEILKKIKLCKRALDRCLPGFMNSIQKESVSFEPRMRAELPKKRPVREVLGATLVTDSFGMSFAVRDFLEFFGGVNQENGERIWLHQPAE
jgi:hypothetical protein